MNMRDWSGIDRLLLGIQREREDEASPFPRTGRRDDPAAMTFHDGSANGKAQAHPRCLGGVERVEQGLGDLFRKARAGILDRDNGAMAPEVRRNIHCACVECFTRRRALAANNGRSARAR